ncbi:hypothetical protein M413DRAFT_345656 [Hebeloma cylindrosporum]|uniref:F-box domain-containing protein n=1 Tax=Hebeloma cylindrosporum TaxID=76867 RepID=A0A0C3CA52_HEBCY|nr:hypothetical protein M413DRAFT_345656 [Hebeloma cylindrosporum h7]
MCYFQDHYPRLPLDTNPLSFGPFPRLARLSLTGFAIMEIGWDFPGWIQALEGGPRLQSLKISNFTFRSEMSDSPDGLERNTLQFFVSMLSRINPTRLHLVAMSLSPDSTPRTIPRTYNLSDVYIHFEASSGPFLVDFLSWTQGGIHQSSTITGTETIPHFDTALFGKTLTLHTIPDSASLRAILENFWGETLVFDNCDGFDNTLIQWLFQPNGIQREERANFAAKMLNYIRINSCTNFTSNALRRLVEVRHTASRKNEAALGTIVAMNIDVLNVTGTAPILEPNDQSWFTMNPDVVEVTWYREEPDSYSMYMFDNIQD